MHHLFPGKSVSQCVTYIFAECVGARASHNGMISCLESILMLVFSYCFYSFYIVMLNLDEQGTVRSTRKWLHGLTNGCHRLS